MVSDQVRPLHERYGGLQWLDFPLFVLMIRLIVRLSPPFLVENFLKYLPDKARVRFIFRQKLNYSIHQENPLRFNQSFLKRGAFICLFYFGGGSCAWSHGDVHLQIHTLSQKIAHHAETDELLRRALLWRNKGQLDKAWDDYQRVLKQNSINTDALYYGAKTVLERGQVAHAQSLAQRFFLQLKQRPYRQAAYARAYQLFSDIALARGDTSQALQWSKKSMALKSHSVPGEWLRLADLSLQQEGYQPTLAILKQALSRLPGTVSIQQEIIRLSMQENDYKTALCYLDKQLRKAAALRKVVLLAKKSEVLALAGNQQQSLQWRQQARRAFQRLPTSRKSLPAAKQLERQLAKQGDL